MIGAGSEEIAARSARNSARCRCDFAWSGRVGKRPIRIRTSVVRSRAVDVRGWCAGGKCGKPSL